MAEQLDISLVERQRCAIEFWNPTTRPSSLWRRCNETCCGFETVEALWRRRNERERSKLPVTLSSWSLRQTVCSTFSRSGWSVVRRAPLAKEGTWKKRPSPHLHKVPTRSNNVSPKTFQTALVCALCLHVLSSKMLKGFRCAKDVGGIVGSYLACLNLYCVSPVLSTHFILYKRRGSVVKNGV
jgi:hypothetical protein